MNGPWYDTAQICTNGHVVTSSLIKSPEWGKKFCVQCGAPTITKCQNCGENIKGIYHIPGVIDFRSYEPPKFCHNCGKPYPWIKEKLKAAKELINGLDKLKDDERELLKKSLDDIIRDTPQTTAAATRFKKLADKRGKATANAFKDILVDIVSETAKKRIWPS